MKSKKKRDPFKETTEILEQLLKELEYESAFLPTQEKINDEKEELNEER